MTQIIGRFNEEQDRYRSYIKQGDAARRMFNTLPLEVRTLDAQEVHLAVGYSLEYVTLTYRFRASDTNDADELCSEVVRILISAGVEFTNDYVLDHPGNDYKPETWQRIGELKVRRQDTEKEEYSTFQFTVIGFSRPIGYEIVKESKHHEAFTSERTVVKCSFK